MRIFPAFLLLFVFLGTSGAVGEPPPDTLTNRTCPVMIGTPIDPSLWVDHDGKRVYFCCEKCVQRFRENPDFYLANLESGGGAAAVDDLYTEWDGGEFTGRLVRFLGNLHPVAVHFPIALALAALLAEVLYLFYGTDRCRQAARFILLLGGLSAVAAVPLGYAAAWGLTYPPAVAANFGAHRILGTAGGALLAIAMLLREWSVRSGSAFPAGASRIALFAAAAAIAVAGYHGGVLVYGPGHFQW